MAAMENVPRDTDQELVERVLVGNGDAFDELYIKYYPEMLKWLYSVGVSNEEDRRELAQDIMMKAFKSLRRFDREKGTFEVWLHAVTRNHAYDQFRQSRNRLTTVAFSTGEELAQALDAIPDEYPSILSRLEENERWEFLLKCCDLIPVPYHEPFKLRYCYGMAYDEIALRLKITANAAMVYASRGKKIVLSKLLDQCREGVAQ